MTEQKKKNKNKAALVLCCLLPFPVRCNCSNNDVNDFTNTFQHQERTVQNNVVELPHLLLPPDLKMSLSK